MACAKRFLFSVLVFPPYAIMERSLSPNYTFDLFPVGRFLFCAYFFIFLVVRYFCLQVMSASLISRRNLQTSFYLAVLLSFLLLYIVTPPVAFGFRGILAGVQIKPSKIQFKPCLLFLVFAIMSVLGYDHELLAVLPLFTAKYKAYYVQ